MAHPLSPSPLPTTNPFLREAPSNPLDLEEIVVYICSFLDHKSLTQVRFLSQQWLKSSTPKVRENSQIVFGSVDKPGQADFLARLLTDADFLTVPSMKLILPKEPLSWLNNQVLRTHGSHLTSLILSVREFHDSDSAGYSEMFVTLLDATIFQWTPNLRHLELSYLDNLQFMPVPQPNFGRKSSSHQNLRSFKFSIGSNSISRNNLTYILKVFSRILERTPNLEEIDLTYPKSDDYFLHFSLYTLYEKAHENFLTKLNSFRLNCIQMARGSIEMISLIPFQNLKRLSLNTFAVKNVCVHQLEMLLSGLAKQLETLILGGFEEPHDSPTDPPCPTLPSDECDIKSLKILSVMDKLKVFENHAADLFLPGDISFIKHTPNLEVLVLKTVVKSVDSQVTHLWNSLISQEDQQDSQEVYSIGSLHTLRVGAAFHLTVDNLIGFDALISKFPNLKVFETSLIGDSDDGSFTSFMKSVSKLKCLETFSLGVKHSKLSEQVTSVESTKASFEKCLQLFLPQLPCLWKFELSFDESNSRMRCPLTFDLFQKMFCRPDMHLTSVSLSGFQVIPDECERIIQFLQSNTSIYNLSINRKRYT